MSTVIRARVTEDFKEEFFEIAKKNEHNASYLIRNWMNDYIEQYKKEEKERPANS